VARKTCSIPCRVRWARLRNAAQGKARRRNEREAHRRA
jgi:hypothetical protein